MIVQFSYWNDTLRFWGNVYQGPLFRLAIECTGQPLACFHSSGTFLSVSPPPLAAVLSPMGSCRHRDVLSRLLQSGNLTSNSHKVLDRNPWKIWLQNPDFPTNVVWSLLCPLDVTDLKQFNHVTRDYNVCVGFTSLHFCSKSLHTI